MAVCNRKAVILVGRGGKEELVTDPELAELILEVADEMRERQGVFPFRKGVFVSSYRKSSLHRAMPNQSMAARVQRRRRAELIGCSSV